jgi:hypothetical protein
MSTEDEPWYEICEVFYEEGEPWLRTDGISVSGNNIDELRETLERMLKCLDNPILTSQDFKEKE